MTALNIIRAMEAAGCDEGLILKAVRAHLEEAERIAASIPAWSEARAIVIQRDGTVCGYCGYEAAPLHVDHVIPRSRGGSNDPSNLVVACRACNLSKKDKTPEEWRGRYV